MAFWVKATNEVNETMMKQTHELLYQFKILYGALIDNVDVIKLTNDVRPD